MTKKDEETNKTKEKLLRAFGRWENPISEYDLNGIGKCRLCEMTVGDELELSKIIPKARNECTPDELCDFSLRFILRKSKDDKGPSLTEDEVKLIPQNIKEEIFEKLLGESSYLYTKMNSKTTKGADGVHKIELTDGEIIRPRTPEETAIQYYHRVKNQYDQEQSKKLSEQFKKLNFSSGLNSQILESMKSLEQITRPFKDIEKMLNPLKGVEEALNRHKLISDKLLPKGVTLEKIKIEQPEIELPSLDYKMLENPQLTAMRNIQNDIQGNHEHSVTLFAGISETLIKMLNELQGSTKDTNRALSIAIVSLVVSILIGGVQLYYEVKNNDILELKMELQKSQEIQKELIKNFEQIGLKKIQNDELILKELKQLNKK